MKKFRFALLALAVLIFTFAFTPKPEKAPLVTVYAFTATGVFVGSASSVSILKAAFCPGANEIFCLQVWTSKTEDDQPAGTRLPDIKKPIALGGSPHPEVNKKSNQSENEDNYDRLGNSV
ncbi:hypothetical protein [Agriterribacter sp.]|uniref:hypothetical protein n=1 Tax=Agriterribacter sp. TaxID=2821509 RepID=UPI002BE87FCE|nr:hypothetical protein [Agriterribacter sp.]HTN05690.1 hypothetical protein [Agriterribacter sp.]